MENSNTKTSERRKVLRENLSDPTSKREAAAKRPKGSSGSLTRNLHLPSSFQRLINKLRDIKEDAGVLGGGLERVFLSIYVLLRIVLKNGRPWQR
jgi:hypothetical protein